MRQFSFFFKRLVLMIFQQKQEFHKEKYRILIMKANEMHYFSNLFDKVHVSDRSTVYHQELSQHRINAMGICHASSVGVC